MTAAHGFSLRRVETTTPVSGALTGSVIKAAELAVTFRAGDLIVNARSEALRLVEEARARGESLAREQLAEREAKLVLRETELEQRCWQAAAGYAATLAQEWDRAVVELEASASAVVSRAVARLTAEVPDAARVRACVRELIQQAGVPSGGVLLVSDADHDTVAAIGERLPWPLQRSPEVAPGELRLACAQGRWESDVRGALAQLQQALGGPHDPAPREVQTLEE